MKQRPVAKLHDSLEHRLAMYAMAASAAGVGLLATAQSAAAKVVYTKVHQAIPANVAVPLDLNRDGVADFSLFLRQTTYRNSLDVLANQSNQVAGYCGVLSSSYCGASALLPAVRVGPNRRFGPYKLMVAGGGCSRTSSSSRSYCRSFGPWGNVRKRYLGFEFFVKGKIHYGWARLNVDIDKVAPVLTGYAYETVPNKSLVTGKTRGPDVIVLEPKTLGHLASGVSARRTTR